MGKGDVILKFDAETASYVQKVLALKSAHEQTADSARKMGDAVAQSGDKSYAAMVKMEESSHGVASAIGAISGVALTAGAAIETMYGIADSRMKMMETRAETLEHRVRSLNSSLAGSGQGSVAPEVRAEINRMDKVGGMSVSHEEATRVYSAISAGMGNKIDADEKMAATEAAMKARAAGMDETKATEFGMNFAHLAHERRPGGGFEGYTDDQLGDLSYAVTAGKPGGMSDRDLRFFARAKDKRQALTLLLAGAQSEESARALGTIQQAADEDFDPDEIQKIKREESRNSQAHPVNAEDKRKLRLAEIPKEDRTSAMVTDPTLAPQSERVALRNLSEGIRLVKPTPSLQAVIDQRRSHADYETTVSDAAHEAAVSVEREEEKKQIGDAANAAAADEAWAKFKRNNPQLSDLPGAEERVKRRFNSFMHDAVIPDVKTLKQWDESNKRIVEKAVNSRTPAAVVASYKAAIIPGLTQREMDERDGIVSSPSKVANPSWYGDQSGFQSLVGGPQHLGPSLKEMQERDSLPVANERSNQPHDVDRAQLAALLNIQSTLATQATLAMTRRDTTLSTSNHAGLQ